jgi:ABC-type sugar transport system substrate-binding protein
VLLLLLLAACLLAAAAAAAAAAASVIKVHKLCHSRNSIYLMNLSSHPWFEPVTKQIEALMAANNAR